MRSQCEKVTTRKTGYVSDKQAGLIEQQRKRCPRSTGGQEINCTANQEGGLAPMYSFFYITHEFDVE